MDTTDENAKAIETPLRRLRIERKLSLQQVADALKVNNGTLSRVERGQGTTPETAAALVAFFGQGITEMEILYPERYMPSQPSEVAAGAVAP